MDAERSDEIAEDFAPIRDDDGPSVEEQIREDVVTSLRRAQWLLTGARDHAQTVRDQWGPDSATLSLVASMIDERIHDALAEIRNALRMNGDEP